MVVLRQSNPVLESPTGSDVEPYRTRKRLPGAWYRSTPAPGARGPALYKAPMAVLRQWNPALEWPTGSDVEAHRTHSRLPAACRHSPQSPVVAQAWHAPSKYGGPTARQSGPAATPRQRRGPPPDSQPTRRGLPSLPVGPRSRLGPVRRQASLAVLRQEISAPERRASSDVDPHRTRGRLLGVVAMRTEAYGCCLRFLLYSARATSSRPWVGLSAWIETEARRRIRPDFGSAPRGFRIAAGGVRLKALSLILRPPNLHSSGDAIERPS